MTWPSLDPGLRDDWHGNPMTPEERDLFRDMLRHGKGRRKTKGGVFLVSVTASCDRCHGRGFELVAGPSITPETRPCACRGS